MYFVGVAARSVRAASGVYETAWFRNQLPKRRVATGSVRQHARRSFAPCIAPTLLFAVLAVQLYARITIIKRGYELEVLRGTTLHNDVTLRQTRLEYAFLTGPANLSTVARQRLEMTPLTPQRMRTLARPVAPQRRS